MASSQGGWCKKLMSKDKANRIKHALGAFKSRSKASTLDVVQPRVYEPRKVMKPVGRDLQVFGSAKAARRAAYKVSLSPLCG